MAQARQPASARPTQADRRVIAVALFDAEKAKPGASAVPEYGDELPRASEGYTGYMRGQSERRVALNPLTPPMFDPLRSHSGLG